MADHLMTGCLLSWSQNHDFFTTKGLPIYTHSTIIVQLIYTSFTPEEQLLPNKSMGTKKPCKTMTFSQPFHSKSTAKEYTISHSDHYPPSHVLDCKLGQKSNRKSNRQFWNENRNRIENRMKTAWFRETNKEMMRRCVGVTTALCKRKTIHDARAQLIYLFKKLTVLVILFKK